jgi:tRNA pseudouridine13 synthase
MSEHPDIDGRPAKRARLDDTVETAPLTPSIAATTSTELPKAPIASRSATIDGDLEREVRAGITEYVCPDNLGFTGTLKQRYTDFLVNEIGLDGKVLHLRFAGVEKKNGERKVDGGRQSGESVDSKQEGKIDAMDNAAFDAAQKQDVTAEAKPDSSNAEGRVNGHEDIKSEKQQDQQVCVGQTNYNASYSRFAALR